MSAALTLSPEQIEANCRIIYGTRNLSTLTADDKGNLSGQTWGAYGRSWVKTPPAQSAAVEQAVIATLSALVRPMKADTPICFFVSQGRTYNSVVTVNYVAQKILNDPTWKAKTGMEAAANAIVTAFNALNFKINVGAFEGKPDDAAINKSVVAELSRQYPAANTPDYKATLTSQAVAKVKADLEAKKANAK